MTSAGFNMIQSVPEKEKVQNCLPASDSKPSSQHRKDFFSSSLLLHVNYSLSCTLSSPGTPWNLGCVLCDPDILPVQSIRLKYIKFFVCCFQKECLIFAVLAVLARNKEGRGDDLSVKIIYSSSLPGYKF